MYRFGDQLKERGFFSSPCVIAERKEYQRLSSSARLVLFYLYQVAHRVSSPRFRASESTFAREFGLDAKTVRTSLVALEQALLLRKTAGKSASVPSEIWLTNPETGVPFPVPEDSPVPTFKSFSKAERTRATSETRHISVISHPRTEETQASRPPQQMATARPVSLVEKPPSSMTTGASGPEKICPIRGHSQIHYRPDGSALCGVCHPTGITEPPRKNFSQPTGKELFG